VKEPTAIPWNPPVGQRAFPTAMQHDTITFVCVYLCKDVISSSEEKRRIQLSIAGLSSEGATMENGMENAIYLYSLSRES
jgi:hypothetical protein